ncbi:hypothetical protein DEO72_LG10g3134 [Vigna unguiculata]|uniref:Uncharacterized protein n=1 Tax=Vigna unguiculata TaxID=3917 RepID=A0A4D6NDS3_VIGUN|nr:hypothetical protein DEO72_LG10g3134 [Vigna unguiculata]
MSRKRKISGMPVTTCTHLGKYELGKTIGEGSFAKEDELLRTTCGTPNYVAAELNDSSVYMSIMVFLNLHVLHGWPSCLVKTLCKDIISPFELILIEESKVATEDYFNVGSQW